MVLLTITHVGHQLLAGWWNGDDGLPSDYYFTGRDAADEEGLCVVRG